MGACRLETRCILHTFAGLPSWQRVAWSCLMLVGTTARLWSFPISWYMNLTLRTNGGLSILEAPKRQRQLAIAQPTPILGEPITHHPRNSAPLNLQRPFAYSASSNLPSSASFSPYRLATSYPPLLLLLTRLPRRTPSSRSSNTVQHDL